MTAEAARIVAVREDQRPRITISSPRPHARPFQKACSTRSARCKGTDGKPVAGLFNAWITLDNQTQFNSYTTDMVKATILAFRAASAARDVVAVVFTGAGDKAFCTGGNTKEYAEYYAGNPQEYRRLYAALQRHGFGNPWLRQAGDLPRQRNAHRWRPGNRNGLRFLDCPGSRPLRPGRPEARLGSRSAGRLTSSPT